MKLIIISNRLPVKAVKSKNQFRFVKSEGGLTTGLDSLDIEIEKCWIGWPGVVPDSDTERLAIEEKLTKKDLIPVFLEKDEVEQYYEGYSNSKIWPLCHYFFTLIQHESEHWDMYRKVNSMFAEAALKILEEGDMVWVHDYQLMLVPKMIRDKRSDVNIGYFHHIQIGRASCRERV